MSDSPFPHADRIFAINNPEHFEELALEVFRFQYLSNPVYRNFADLLQKTPGRVASVKEIPFLPASFFKHHTISSVNAPPSHIFYSSGTTGGIPSRHFVHDTALYEKSIISCFSNFFGNAGDYRFFALMPDSKSKPGSSLVYMLSFLIGQSEDKGSGFFLDKLYQLEEKIKTALDEGKKVLVFGLSFALLDLAEQFPFRAPGILLMETGGMKGRREEPTREELHQRLKDAFGVSQVYSEYGMTEMLSQAYSTGEGIFQCPPWMQVMISEVEDPLSMEMDGRTGGINIIDLANIYSCSFIATQDLGKRYPDGRFEVSGRFDHGDIRGCNLLLN